VLCGYRFYDRVRSSEPPERPVRAGTVVSRRRRRRRHQPPAVAVFVVGTSRSAALSDRTRTRQHVLRSSAADAVARVHIHTHTLTLTLTHSRYISRTPPSPHVVENALLRFFAVQTTNVPFRLFFNNRVRNRNSNTTIASSYP